MQGAFQRVPMHVVSFFCYSLCLVLDPKFKWIILHLFLLFRITSENVAERFGVSREKQDKMAFESHMK